MLVCVHCGGRVGEQALGAEFWTLGSLPHTLNALGSLLQGLQGGGAAALEGTSLWAWVEIWEKSCGPSDERACSMARLAGQVTVRLSCILPGFLHKLILHLGLSGSL